MADMETESKSKMDSKLDAKLDTTRTDSKKEIHKPQETTSETGQKIKTRNGSGYLKQLYSTARTTTATTGSNLNKLTTFMVNFIPTGQGGCERALQVRTHFDDAEIPGAFAFDQDARGAPADPGGPGRGPPTKSSPANAGLRASRSWPGSSASPARACSPPTTRPRTRSPCARTSTAWTCIRWRKARGISLPPRGPGLHEPRGNFESLRQAEVADHRMHRLYPWLPLETKQELQRHGLRNRSLLRQLLITPPEKHTEMILDAVGKEEILLAAGQAMAPPDGTGPTSLPASADAGAATPAKAGGQKGDQTLRILGLPERNLGSGLQVESRRGPRAPR